MKSKKVDLNKLTMALQADCHFVLFAIITGFDQEKQVPLEKNLELSVYVESGTGSIMALEKLLFVVNKVVPDFFCEIILLNKTDADSRFKAAGGTCLFIRPGNEIIYELFVSRASFDYRVKRAQLKVWEKRGK
jgi:hypothetical protein